MPRVTRRCRTITKIVTGAVTDPDPLRDAAIAAIRCESAGLDSEPARIKSLTGREREIITLLAEGFDTRKVADRLSLSETTVHRDSRSIFRKLAVADRYELIIYAYWRNLA